MKQFEYTRPDGKTQVGPVSLGDVMDAAKSRVKDPDKPFIVVKDGAHRYPSINADRALLHLRGILDEGHVGVRAVVHKFTPDGTTDPTSKRAGGKIGDAVFAGDRAKNAAQYDNPLRDWPGVIAMRQDMGCDYSTNKDSPIYAIGPARVTRVDTNSGWPGGCIIVYEFTDGPAKGKRVYYAEHLTPRVKAGDHVDSQTAVCTFHPGYPWCELGWAGNDNQALASSYYNEGERTAAGDNFSSFMEAAGAKAGLAEGRPVTGHMPAGYPSNWKGKV